MDLLRSGTHYSEKKGQHVHIINTKTGVTELVVSADPSQMSELVQHTQASGQIIWLEAGITNMISTSNTQYNPMTVQILCQKIAEGGSITKICKQAGMPTYATLCKWRKDYPEIREMLEQAYVDRADTLRDEALGEALLADEDNVDSQKLKHDALKWAAGVDSPRYSPKAKIEATLNIPTQVIVHTGIDRTPKDVTPEKTDD